MTTGRCVVVWCGDHRAVCCGVKWSGVVWCGAERYGVMWCGVVWCGVVWCVVVRCQPRVALPPSAAHVKSQREGRQ